MKVLGLLFLLSPVSAFAKTAIVCAHGKDPEKYLNALLNEDTVIYSTKAQDKEDPIRSKEEIHVIKPKQVSAPVFLENKVCVTVTE